MRLLPAWAPKLSSRERRVAVSGAAMVTLTVLVTQGVPRWQKWTQETRLDAMELVNELATVRASLARSAEHDVALRAAAARADSAAMLLLSGRSPAAAAAALASIVSAAARSADVRLGAVQWSTDSSSGFLGRARVRAEGEGDVRGLTRLLLALERGPVALRISELTVAQPDPEATDDVAEALRFQFVIDGLYLRSVTAGGDGDA